MSTTTDQTTTARDETRTLTIDHLDCMDAIAGLQKMLAGRSVYEMDQDTGDDPDFAAFATGAVGLARLAVALHEHRTRPLDTDAAPHRCADTVDELRAHLAVTLSERETPDPDMLLSGATMHNFTWALHAAVTACPIPREEEVDEEAGKALYHLAGLAQALSEAAGTTAAHIYRRIHDREKALGLFPYDRS